MHAHEREHRYAVHDGNNDGIFEPGEDGLGLTVHRIAVENNGGLRLPVGTVMNLVRGSADPHRIDGDATPVQWTVPAAAVPSMAVGEALVMPEAFHQAIPAVPCSLGRPHVGTVVVCTAARMHNRLFHESSIDSEWTVQFPIQGQQVEGPSFLGPNESGVVNCALRNVSTRPYGSAVAAAHGCSAGLLQVVIECDPIIHVTADRGEGTSDWRYQLAGATPWVATADVTSIAPGQDINIGFHVVMTDKAGDLLLESLDWTVTVYLRGKPIEQRSNKIRVVPTFEPGARCDATLMTSPQMDRNEYLAWSYLLQTLGLSVGLWDVERYGTIASIGEWWHNHTPYPHPRALVLPLRPPPPSSRVGAWDRRARRGRRGRTRNYGKSISKRAFEQTSQRAHRTGGVVEGRE
jgi:hypothetical protein